MNETGRGRRSVDRRENIWYTDSSVCMFFFFFTIPLFFRSQSSIPLLESSGTFSSCPVFSRHRFASLVTNHAWTNSLPTLSLFLLIVLSFSYMKIYFFILSSSLLISFSYTTRSEMGREEEVLNLNTSLLSSSSHDIPSFCNSLSLPRL